ncbi:esterase-like activity of phytase family protein [Ketogulonicigenium robustum]|nr:esterase-like activity of phytase family protein [Ketogulonicigenium robustum]
MVRFTALLSASFLAIAAAAHAQDTAADARAFPAQLAGHAQLPAATFIAPPADAPSYFAQSGRFTAGARVEQPMGIFDEKTGLSRPFAGQPVQGFSSTRSLGDNRFLFLTDNGYGNQLNSADAMLHFSIFKADFDTGRLAFERTIFAHDPDRIVPFPIVTETTDTRYLTGQDFDFESIQPVGDGYWIGDEFGPWLIQLDGNGRVLQVVATEVDGQLYRSPDNAFVQAPAPAGQLPDNVIVQRSGGYEGMALGSDGTTLYPMIEKTVYNWADGSFESINGTPVLRIFEYDTVANAWGDKVRFYPLEDASYSMGSFNMIPGTTRALVIERDQNEGDPRDAAFTKPANFKRIYLIDLERADENGVLEKIAYIDLMNIADPNGLAPRGTIDGVFNFPFMTIEDVDWVNETTIVVANDNNYPFSVGREFGRADDNEVILLDVADFLKAD